MFSIIIPLYNKEVSIANTIQSVVNQVFGDFEIIVVNDGSTDGSLDVVRRIKDTRLRIVEKTNGGVSSARNRGIKEANHDWIVFLDGDDLWDGEHLKTLVAMIQDFPGDSVFCTSYIRSNESMPSSPDRSVTVVEDYYSEAIKRHFFWTSVACIHVCVFKEIGVFNEALSRGEDLDLWSRIGRRYRFVRSNLVTAVYRVEAENRSDQSFVIEESRVFNYDFAKSRGESETLYFKKQIINSLATLLKKNEFRQFFRLKNKHRTAISYMDILNLFIK